MGAAWITMMPPVNSAVTTTMGSDLTPILYMLRKSSLASKLKRTSRVMMRPSITPMPPTTVAVDSRKAPSMAKGVSALDEEVLLMRGGAGC